MSASRTDFALRCRGLLWVERRLNSRLCAFSLSRMCMMWYADKPHWAVIVSRGSKYTKQVIEMDFQYPSEGIHYHWDQGEYFSYPGEAKTKSKAVPGSPSKLRQFSEQSSRRLHAGASPRWCLPFTPSQRTASLAGWV